MMTLQNLNLLAWTWIAVAVLTFLALQRFTAPYGRHATNKWGPMISNRWGWVLMEAPSLLIFAWLFISGPVEKTSPMWILFLLWTGHYFYRSLVFPFRTRTSGKMMPVVIPLMAVLFNIVNAGMNGYYLGYLTESYPVSWMRDPRFIFGLAIFLTGVFINQRSDQKLLSLRKDGQTGYSIPEGGLFSYISCPNFFGEIVEWTGFAIMAWNLPAFSFAVWTALNLIPRAMDHHRWYIDHFENYPKERKAVIPYIL